MSEDPENLTIRLLREMLEEMRDGFRTLNERVAALGQSAQLRTIIGLLANHADRLELLEGRDR